MIVAPTALVIAALFLILFRWRHEEFDWSRFGSTFLHLNWLWVLASALLAIGTFYGRALRWAVLIKPLRPSPSIWNLFSATVIGFTAIVLLGRPAELVRPYLIAVKERVPFSSQLAAWLLERIFDLLMALLIFGFALAQVERSGATVGSKLEWVLKVGGYFVGLLCAAGLAILILLRHFSEAMRHRLLEALAFLPAHALQKASDLVTAFVQGVEATKDRSSLTLLLFYTVLEWVLITACYFALFRAFPDLASFRPTDILIFMGFVAFGSIVQIPGVGGGMQLVSIVVLTELFRLPLELATSVAIAVWIITFVVVVPIGVPLILHEGLNWQKIKEMEAKAAV